MDNDNESLVLEETPASIEISESDYNESMEDVWGLNGEESSNGNEADQQSDDTDTDVEQTDEQTDDESESEDQWIEVKHLDENRKLNKKESVEYAQKGMDYDRIRGKLEESNYRLAEYEAEHKFLQSIQGNFPSIKDLMIDTRVAMLMDKGASEEQARRDANEEFKDIVLPKAVPTAEEENDAKRRKSFEIFARDNADLKLDPEKDIPIEVWKDVDRSNSLEASYFKYMYNKAKEELDVYHKNEENSKLSTSSSKSKGKGKGSSYANILDDVFSEKNYW